MATGTVGFQAQNSPVILIVHLQKKQSRLQQKREFNAYIYNDTGYASFLAR